MLLLSWSVYYYHSKTKNQIGKIVPLSVLPHESTICVQCRCIYIFHEISIKLWNWLLQKRKLKALWKTPTWHSSPSIRFHVTNRISPQDQYLSQITSSYSSVRFRLRCKKWMISCQDTFLFSVICNLPTVPMQWKKLIILDQLIIKSQW